MFGRDTDEEILGITLTEAHRRCFLWWLLDIIMQSTPMFHTLGSSSSWRKFFPRDFLYSLYSGRCRPEGGEVAA